MPKAKERSKEGCSRGGRCHTPSTGTPRKARALSPRPKNSTSTHIHATFSYNYPHTSTSIPPPPPPPPPSTPPSSATSRLDTAHYQMSTSSSLPPYFCLVRGNGRHSSDRCRQNAQTRVGTCATVLLALNARRSRAPATKTPGLVSGLKRRVGRPRMWAGKEHGDK
ncbi:hypothetical protein E2C01_051009 [Portunus trituberculatus]|uniref:Uncharacterized protein n=1 Tax=Portunus trituberculatus TaxID=210409 RepID=A0A5B7GAH0_PORTR|nr:hypothetical protein [Portunus trituberculatus]